MSFHAMSWACGTEEHPMVWGGSSARSAIMAITHHTDDDWFCCVKQETLARESEQSPDSIQRRIQEFIDMGRIRRIKLRRFGRRTQDFLILKPSRYFEAPIEELVRFLPRDCEVMIDPNAAADCGSDENDSAQPPSADSTNHAAADCGSESAPTLPQPAPDATALVRQPKEESFLGEKDSPPLTPPQPVEPSGPSKEASPGFGAFVTEFQETYPRPSNNPDRDRDLMAEFTALQREQVLHGARGARVVFNRNPKSMGGIVGPSRYLRSSALWAEYGRYAPPGKPAPPPPRVFEALGSPQWWARSVLYAIAGLEMPAARAAGLGGVVGADFNGSLPADALVFAQFVDQFGNVDTKGWSFLWALDQRHGMPNPEAVERDHPKIAAWAERVNECLGIRLKPGMLKVPDGIALTQVIAGDYHPVKWRPGLLVPPTPSGFPPPKGDAPSSS